MRALLEIGFIVHPGQCYRTHVPFNTDDDSNVVVGLCAAMGHHFVGACHLIVDITNQRYLKNRQAGTSLLGDEAADIIKSFPYLPYESVKNIHANPTDS